MLGHTGYGHPYALGCAAYVFQSSFTDGPHLGQSTCPSRSAVTSLNTSQTKQAPPEDGISTYGCNKVMVPHLSFNRENVLIVWWWGDSFTPPAWALGKDCRRMSLRKCSQIERLAVQPWTERDGLIGWKPWPRILLHTDSIFRNQHQSWTWVVSLSRVAGTRWSICKSTFTVGSVRRCIGSSLRLSFPTNLSQLTCATANTTKPSHQTMMAMGLPMQRVGMPKVPSPDVFWVWSIVNVLGLCKVRPKRCWCGQRVRAL